MTEPKTTFTPHDEKTTFNQIAENMGGTAGAGDLIAAMNGFGNGNAYATAGRSVIIPSLTVMKHTAKNAPQYSQFYAIIYSHLRPELGVVLPKEDDEGFGFGSLVTILAVGIACVVAPYLATGLYSLAGIPGMAGAIATGTASAGATAGFAATEGVMAGLANAALQGIAVGVGAQDHFSMQESLSTMISAGVGGFFGGELNPSEMTQSLLASAKIAVSTQLGNMMVGASSHFNLMDVATQMAQTMAGLKAQTYAGEDSPLEASIYSTTAASAVQSIRTQQVNIQNLAIQATGNLAVAGVGVGLDKYAKSRLANESTHNDSTLDNDSTQNTSTVSNNSTHKYSTAYSAQQRAKDEAFYGEMSQPVAVADPILLKSDPLRKMEADVNQQAIADKADVIVGSWREASSQKNNVSTLGIWKPMPRQSFADAVVTNISNDAYHAANVAKAFHDDMSGSTVRLLKTMGNAVLNAASDPRNYTIFGRLEKELALGESAITLYNVYRAADPATQRAMLARGVASGIELTGAGVLTRGVSLAASRLTFIGSGARIGGGLASELGAVGGGEESAANFAAKNHISGLRLKYNLVMERASALSDNSGRLTQETLNNAELIIPGRDLGNKALREILESRGGNISDWGKYATPHLETPSGGFSTHFYYNPVTNDVYYGMDYKSVLGHEGKWNLPLTPKFDTEPPKFN